MRGLPSIDDVPKKTTLPVPAILIGRMKKKIKPKQKNCESYSKVKMSKLTIIEFSERVISRFKDAASKIVSQKKNKKKIIKVNRASGRREKFEVEDSRFAAAPTPQPRAHARTYALAFQSIFLEIFTYGSAKALRMDADKYSGKRRDAGWQLEGI